MLVFNGFDESITLTKPVAAVGSFDGVHLGHQRLLECLRNAAGETGGQSVVVTFHPHPRQVLHPGSGFFTINTLEENLQKLDSAGVEAAIVVPFTKAFSELTYVEFLEQYLIGRLHVHALLMGPHHTMGHGGGGHIHDIETVCLKHGVNVIEIPEYQSNDIEVRSCRIRELISRRQFDKADELLGYHYNPKPSAKETTGQTTEP